MACSARAGVGSIPQHSASRPAARTDATTAAAILGLLGRRSQPTEIRSKSKRRLVTDMKARTNAEHASSDRSLASPRAPLVPKPMPLARMTSPVVGAENSVLMNDSLDFGAGVLSAQGRGWRPSSGARRRGFGYAPSDAVSVVQRSPGVAIL